jgi:CheY-like chemotaxis protein
MATRLLLADDSITIQKVVSLTFAAEDVQIESVTDGNLAVERAKAGRPDIVLADVFMPGRNGYEVCAAIKSDPGLAGTPVVLLVGTFEPFDEGEASRVKCDAYLTKPFDTSELIRIVHDLVRQHGLKETSGERAETAPESRVLEAVAGDRLPQQSAMLVSERTRNSFLGTNRILDLFDFSADGPESVVPAKAGTSTRASISESPTGRELENQQPGAAAPHVIPFPSARGSGLEPFPIALTDEMIDVIVEKVVKRMSQEIVREIAWEVVPELSEIMIRQYLDELGAPRKT